MSQDVDIGRRITGISNKIRHLLDASVVERDITGTQASILHYLARTTPKRDVFQRDIEAEFYIRRSSVTSVLHGLESKGYIRRESVSEDARLKKIVLTEKAQELSKHIFELTDSISDMLLRGMVEEDINRLDTLLKTINNNLP